MKGAKIFMNKKKTNSINMLKGSVEIFLKKEKKKKHQYGRERHKILLDD